MTTEQFLAYVKNVSSEVIYQAHLDNIAKLADDRAALQNYIDGYFRNR